MKARTRILAMLLTVLMVGGLLPLSIFAADSMSGSSLSDATQMKPVDRTLEDIRKGFAEVNYGLSGYHSFEMWEFEDGKSEYVFETREETHLLTPYMDFRGGTENQFSLKNSRSVFSIKTEADGNVALYVGSAGVTESYSAKDTFIDFNHALPNSFNQQAGNGSHDLFVSVDVKMDGANICEAYSTGLFGVLYRLGNGASASIVTTVSLSSVGGIYVGNGPSADKLVGFLSQTEYTRIAVEIRRTENKFYVYINDVLANPEGQTLFSDEIIEAMNTSDKKTNGVEYTAQNMPICNFRMFNYNAASDEKSHKGLWLDNFLIGTRIAVNSASTPFRDIFTSRFTSNLVGQNVSLPLQGTTNEASVGVIWPGAIKYVEDSFGDVAIQWQRMDADSSTTNDQAYFNFNNPAAKGSNLRLSMDLMLGADGCVGNSSGEGLFFFRSEREKKARETNFSVQLFGSSHATTPNQLFCDGKYVGTLTKTEYHNLTVDIVCNSIGGSIMALVFFDGELMVTKTITINYAGAGDYGPTDFHPNMIRFYNIYDGGVANLKDKDLMMKNLSYSVTTDYNGGATEAPFQKDVTGFITNAGLSYYFDAEGKRVDKNFELDGESYVVGYAGNIICKESDGSIVAPYAPFVDWDHTGTLLRTSISGNFLNNGTDNGKGVIGYSRDSFSTPANIPNLYDPVRLYTSYYVPSTDGNENNSYAQWDIDEALMTNSSLVLDFDIMMAPSVKADDKSPDWHTFFYFVGKNSTDASGSRIDTPLFDMDSDGWFRDGSQKLFKVSQTEFTRFSVVLNTPSDGEANGTIDLYANGVLVLDNIPLAANVKRVEGIRLFNAMDQDIAYYVKDAALYEGSHPQKFYTLGDDGIELVDNTNDDTNTENDKAPVKASDLKNGFVAENGVVRYYGENGLIVAARSGLVDFEVNGDYKADVNGVVYTVNDTDASITPGKDYTVDFRGVQSGDYGYAASGSGNTVFEIKFSSNYFVTGEYTSVKFDIYLPAAILGYEVKMGQAERFYKVEWLGDNNFKRVGTTYVTELPENAILYNESYNLENPNGGESSIVYVDNDDIVGLSVNDEFYVRTEIMTSSVVEGAVEAGWYTVDAPIVDNGDFGIDSLKFISGETVLDGIQVSAVKLSKTVRFMMNAEAADGVSDDGYYFKGGIAQVGWIDENNSEDIDAGDYYVSADSSKIVTGIYSVDGVWYEFGTDGKLIGKANGVKSVMNGFNKFGVAISAYKMFDNGSISLGLVEAGVDENNEKIFLYTNEYGIAAQNTIVAMEDGSVYIFDIDGYGKVLCANADAHVYDDGVMVKAGTCTDTGVKEFTCTLCGSKKQEDTETDPNFHTEYDEKGIATCCAGDVKADGVTSIYGYSIAIGESVNIVFYLDVTGTVGEIEFGRRSEYLGNETHRVAITDLEEVTIGDKTYKKVVVGVAPNALDAVAIIRYVREDGLYGTSYEYKVREYLEAVAARPENDEVFTAEVKALVNAFNVYADNVNMLITGKGTVDEITDVDETTFTTDYDVQWNSNQKNEQNGYIKLEKTYENISFVYADTIKIKVNFAISGVSGDFKFFVNGKEVTAEITESGHHAVEVTVNASELDELMVVTVTHISGAELSLRTSAVAVAKRMYMSNNTTDDEKNLMRAIYKYDQAVEAYLDSIAPVEAE